MASGILTKDIELRYSTTKAGAFTKLDGLFEIPDLGSEPEMIDVTNLSDGNMKYIHGLKDYGSLTFSFIYDGEGADSNYKLLKDLEVAGNPVFWEVAIPGAAGDSTKEAKFDFSGTPAVWMSGAGVNARVEFQLSIALDSDIETSF
jgi:hypothetical protein